MAIIKEKNSLSYITKYPPMRCDTHFRHNIELADVFFSDQNTEWVSLGSVLEDVRNGMNVSTEFYSMEETDILYISVLQIKEYGLIGKNQNYLMDTICEQGNYFDISENNLLITRSGTIVSSSHPSFNLQDYTYVASGFVITAKIKDDFPASIIANYINLFDVQRYLLAMSAGACQKNISQPVICNLPIPSVVLEKPEMFASGFAEYESESLRILREISKREQLLAELMQDVSTSIKRKIEDFYRD